MPTPGWACRGWCTRCARALVAVVNPVGSGVLEHPGLAAYLPRVARAVLGEDLTLASPGTWWCGETASRAHTLAHLDRLVLMSGDRTHPVLGWTLDAAAREELAARIAAEPLRWTAQEPVPGATVTDGGVGGPGTPSRGGSSVLRTFAVADGDGYQVLAGGLALVAPPGAEVVSGSRGAVARDVWVISADVEAPADPWATGAPDELLPRRTVSLPPRTAENLFWLTRYAERAGDTVRLLRAGSWTAGTTTRAVPRRPGEGPWPCCSTRSARTTPAAGRRPRTAVRRSPETASAVGCAPCCSTATRPARSPGRCATWPTRPPPCATRCRTTSGCRWRAWSAPWRSRRPPSAAPGSTTGLLPVLDRLLEALLAVAGVAGEGMLRDPGWHLMDAGRRLERSMYLVESLDATVTTVRPDDVESYVLESLLIAHESSITYRRQHSRRPDLPGVLDLLVGDTRNPRSLVFQLDRLRDDLAHVPAASTDARDRLVQDLLDLAGELDPRPASAAVGDRREHLAEILESLRWRLAGLADEVAAAHFAHRPASRALGDQWGLR